MNMFTPTQLHLLSTAIQCFSELGFHASTMRVISKRAGVSLGLTYRYFPSKEAIVLAQYRLLAEELAEAAADLPKGTMAERFSYLMGRKLDLIQPHRQVLVALIAYAMDPEHRLGVLSGHTSAIRDRVSGLFASVVYGAKDTPKHPERWSRLLYGLHLALIILWTQDQSEDAAATRRVMALLSASLQKLPKLSPLLPGFGKALAQLDNISADLLQSASHAPASARSRALAMRLLTTRRVLPGVPVKPSEAALALHLPLIEQAVQQDAPLTLILPAFPAKAPSPTKTLGPLPDLAEQLALDHLQTLVDDLNALHPPGVKLIICSDGHVFADVVSVSDEDVNGYRAALRHKMKTTDITLFDLQDVFPKLTPPQARARLLESWIDEPEAFRTKVKGSASLQRMVDGLHRFLTEDAMGLHPELSRSQARKQTREDAYEVVRRSQAWSHLLAAWFPGAIRLSIHPQPEVSDKIGVHLLPVDDVWMTPWHGVALLGEHGVRLVKRADAERQGAQRLHDHYELS